MKKLTFIILTFIICPFFINAQIEVKQDGSLDMNENELYLRNESTSKYGIGYGAFGATQMTIFSDQYIEFRESDVSKLCAKYYLNGSGTSSFEYYGDMFFNREHWSGGLKTDIIAFGGYDMPSLMPSSGFFGTLGTVNNYFGGGYIQHMFAAIYDTWPSDKRLKENIKNVDSAIEIIKKLKPVYYDIKESFYDSINDINAKKVLKKNGKNKIGFIAQEVMEVLPTAVHQEPQSGFYGIDQMSFIPLLVQAIKEQEEKIEYLEEQLNDFEVNCCIKEKSPNTKSGYYETTIEKEVSISNIVLEQNTPNPFSETTTIGMYLPEEVSNAKLYVYYLNGSQMNETIISERGQTQVHIAANTLTAGLYLYTLICDGKLIATRQMIVTE